MKKIAWLVVLVVLGIPGLASAASLGWTNSVSNLGGYLNGLGFESNLANPIASLIAAALTLLGIIFLVLVVYAGFLWMTAAGNSENVEKAQKIITMAIIGLVIVISAYAITYFITHTLGAGPGGNGDNGKSAYCSEQGGSCIGPDADCPGGTIISGFTDCRCCLPADKSDVKLPGVNECWYEGDTGC